MSTATTRRHRFKHVKFAGEAKQAIDKITSLQKPRYKTANIGGDQESQFEQAFASLAFAYMKDKAPRLLDFMIGFQLVDRNDDNTKAVGVFGFKVGDQWVYAPVFFLNGDLKGHELLYIKAQDQFVPLKEDWVNYLLNRKPHILGEGTPYNLQQLGVMRPMLSSLHTSPHTKRGSADFEMPEKLAAWCREFLPFLAAAEVAPTKVFTKFAGLNERLDLRTFLSQDLRFIKMAMQAAEDYPLIKKSLNDFYGPNLFADCLRSLRAKTVKQGSLLAAEPAPQPTWNMQRTTLLGDVDPTMQRQKVSVLKVDDNQPITYNLPDLTEEEQEKLRNDKVLIKDERDPHAKSVAYNTQIEMRLSNPSSTGLYDLLTAEGEFERCLVICGPLGTSRAEFVTIVRLDGKKNWLNAYKSQIWVRDVESVDDFRKWQEKDRGELSVEVGATYVAVTANGEGSLPFEVEKKLDDGCYRVYFREYSTGPKPITAGTSRFVPNRTLGGGDLGGFDDGQDRIYFTKHKGTKLRAMRNSLYIPADAKLIKVKEVPEWRRGLLDGDEDSVTPPKNEAPSPIVPGDLAGLTMQLVQKTARLKIYSNRTEYWINKDAPRSKMAALVTLVCDHGFSEKSARIMLDEAFRKESAIYRVKYADPYMTNQGEYAPPFPPPEYGYDSYPNGNGVQTMEMQSDHVEVPGLESANTDQTQYDPWLHQQPDPNAMQSAQQAGQSGQKEVFDTHMIGGMLKAVREDSLVDRYLGDLLKALDRLGRVLFMFYWHNEEFSDRYGKQDMPELEDSLRNTFESLGDVTLFLKQKTVEPYSGQSMSEPSIEQSARN